MNANTLYEAFKNKFTILFTVASHFVVGSHLIANEPGLSIVQQATENRTIDVLLISGTNSGDSVEVSNSRRRGFVNVSFNGQVSVFNRNQFSRIRFLGKNGNDIFTNLTNIDSAAYGHDGDDVLRGGNGHNWIQGGPGNDEIYGGDRNDLLRGRQGNDLIDGGKRHDRIFGGEGDDLIIGASGNDRIFGDDGDDTIFGGNGDDRVTGGAGSDEINLGGSQGGDTVVYIGEESRFEVEGDDVSMLFVRFKRNSDLDLVENADFFRFASVETPVDEFVTPSAVVELNEEEREVLRLLNSYREAQGRRRLSLSNDVVLFAREWLDTVIAPLGQRPDLGRYHAELEDISHLFDADPSRIGYGENLAWFPNANLSPREVARRIHSGWVNSTNHRRNMLDRNFDEVGLGVVKTRHGWFLMQSFFARN